MNVKVYLLGRPTFDRSYQAFLDKFLPADDSQWEEASGATPAERLVEFAGRVCYMSFGSHQAPGTNADYIRKLIRNEHESVLEHAAWTVLISGVSRAFTHQLVRHRVGFAFSQLSQQYHDESDIRFVRPPGIDQDPELAKVWDDAMQQSQKAYRTILGKLATEKVRAAMKSSREVVRAMRSAARSVLPNASETVVVATINARALRHFLKVRGGIVGDAEMRCVAAALLDAIRPEGPALFSDFFVEHLSDGLPLVVHRPITRAKESC
jgi:thymidylate synthase (FAD)